MEEEAQEKKAGVPCRGFSLILEGVIKSELESVLKRRIQLIENSSASISWLIVLAASAVSLQRPSTAGRVFIKAPACLGEVFPPMNIHHWRLLFPAFPMPLSD